MLDVCLVSMPYAVNSAPLLSVGLLVAEAKQAGLRARAVHPTFWFAEKIGLRHYSILSEVSIPEHLLGEWTFAGAAFPDYEPDHDAFLTPRLEAIRPLFPDVPDLRARLWEIRRQAVEFIDESARRILDLKPRIVGCSSTFQQHVASLALCRRLKELAPEVVTLLGGGNCTGPMGAATQRAFEFVDHVVSGEADQVFGPLCRAVVEKGGRLTLADLPQALAQRLPALPADAAATRAPLIDAPAVARLDDLPVPDFDDFFAQLEAFPYRDFIRPGLSVETSRGCWWGQKDRCTFCGLFDTIVEFRSKSAERMLEELRTLAERHALTKFVWTDLILDVKYFKTLLPSLAACDPAPYVMCLEVKANLREDQVEMLARAGVRWVQPGIESLSDQALKALHKGNSAANNIALLKYGSESGIWVIWQMLAGIPGEDEAWYEEMAAWLPLVSHLQPPAQVLQIRYDRFSPYHEQQAAYGLALVPGSSYAYVYPLAPADLNDIAYFFEDRNGVVASAADKGPAALKLEALVKQWRRLRLRPPNGVVPALTLRTEGARTIVTDTRPCADAPVIVLEGLEHAVHDACRKPRQRATLLRDLESALPATAGAQALEGAIESLIARRLLLDLDGQLLTLATLEPRRPLLPIKDVPSGFNFALTNPDAASKRQMVLSLAGILAE